MSLSWKRTPRGYRGTRPTTHHLSEVLEATVQSIAQRVEGEEQVIKAAWPKVVGEHLAGETTPIDLRDGILWVRVSRAPLLTILAQRDREWILRELRRVCPRISLRGIAFKLG